jgi:hypothetical protein
MIRNESIDVIDRWLVILEVWGHSLRYVYGSDYKS